MRSKKRSLPAALLLAALLMVVPACSGAGDGAPPATPQDLESSARTIEVVGLDYGENTLTVLNIWATWCPPCVAELPELQRVDEAFSQKGVQVVGVLQDGVTELGEPKEDVIAAANTLLDEAGAQYLVILPDETIQADFISRMQYFPTTFFLDSSGNVVEAVIGANSYESWSEKIDAALEKLDNV